jgi:hypothetical protein
MAKKKLVLLVIGAIVVVLILLGSEGPVDRPLSTGTRGSRILGIDVSMAADNNYDKAFATAKNAGMQEIGLYFNWDDIETSPGVYNNPYFQMANTFYPPTGTMVDLTITPIHTNQLVVPGDLGSTSFDDPVMIERFTDMLDWVFSEIPDLEVSSVVIGSEFDVYFGTDKNQWEKYQVFYREVTAYVKEHYPDTKVAAEATFDGLTGHTKEYTKALNEYSDIIGVSYYPLKSDFTVKDPSVVYSDFDTLTTMYKGRTIYFYQLGYPSSPVLKSSEAKQKQFIQEVFRAWDAHASQIKMIDFTWLHDMSPQTVESFKEFYGIGSNNFAEFLATLGLRTYDGNEKEAFKALHTEAKARGW